jgi:hypothetical protein
MTIQAFQQGIRNVGACDAHDAFLGTSITQQVDAAVPDNLLVHDGKFLVDIGLEDNLDATHRQEIQGPEQGGVVFVRKILFRPGDDNNAEIPGGGDFEVLDHSGGAVFSDKGAYNDQKACSLPVFSGCRGSGWGRNA